MDPMDPCSQDKAPGDSSRDPSPFQGSPLVFEREKRFQQPKRVTSRIARYIYIYILSYGSTRPTIIIIF